MKQLTKILMMLTLAAGALTSCSDDEGKLAKELTIDGEDIALANGYVIGNGGGQDDNDHIVSYYRIVLTEDGLTANDGSFSGNGTALDLYLVSPLGYDLKNGTYTFEPSGDINLKNTLQGYVYYGWDGVETVDEYYEIISGTLKLSRSGNNFKITISNVVLLRESDGAEVNGKGSWEGTLDDQALAGYF